MTDLSADALIAQATGAAEQPPKKSALMTTILPVVILSLVAIGGGAGVGIMLSGQSAERAEEAAKQEAKAAAKAKEEFPVPESPDAIAKLQTIITNIATPKMIVRLQASIVYHKVDVPDPAVLSAQIEGDVLAYLRTVDIVQIEGARGFLHLREDLAERARLRSPAVKDFLVESLVAQ